MENISLKNVHIDDDFWSRYMQLIDESVIPYQWSMLNSSSNDDVNSHCIENFRIAAGKSDGSFEGVAFQDSDLAKWLEAVSYSLSNSPNPELETLADEVIELIEQAQQPDGYINTYFTLSNPECKWKNLREGHELYTAGHFIEAAVAYNQATGKRRFLEIVCRFSDLIYDLFLGEKPLLDGCPGHPEIELALMKLYKETSVKKYLDLATYFIDRRGKYPDCFMEEKKRVGWRQIFFEFSDYDPSYAQNHLPVREQTKAEGHAVRAVYLYCAMIDIAKEIGDNSLLDACKKLWDNIVQKRMYITGGIGSSGYLERFTTDYDLPNDRGYCETCASIGLALFGFRMAKATGESHYIDVAERALYNTIIAGIALDGKSFFYVNPLDVWPPNCMEHTSLSHVKPIRQKWFGVACCPPNIARTLASLGQYIYCRSDDRLLLNLYIANCMELDINGNNISILFSTSFLDDGKSVMVIDAEQSFEFTIGLRIPDYVEKYSFAIDGSSTDYIIENGYVLFRKRWEGKTEIAINFEILARFVSANPEIRADIGKIALVKGPMVFCLEQIDNGPNLASIIVDPYTSVFEDWDSCLLGGTPILKFSGRMISGENWGSMLYKIAEFNTRFVDLTAIPYGLWGNRKPGEMTVWMKASI